MRYEATNVNLSRLQDEFIRAGIRFKKYLEAEALNEEGIAQFAWCEFEEGTNMTLVQQVIGSHDPSPLPPQPSEIEKLRLEQAQANAELFEMMLMLTGGAI